MSRPEAVSLHSVVVPDSAVAVEAASFLRKKAPGVLAAHSHRAYQFGGLLGNRDGPNPIPSYCSSPPCSMTSA